MKYRVDDNTERDKEETPRREVFFIITGLNPRKFECALGFYSVSVFCTNRRFKIMDDDRSRSLSFDEFSKGIKDVGLRDMSDEDLKYVFAYFDKDASGTINFDEFLKTIQVGSV